MWDGKVVPCANCYDAQNLLGDANKKSISEIWNSKEMQDFRHKHNTNDLKEIPVCNACWKYRLDEKNFQKYDQCEMRLLTYNNRDGKTRKGLS